MPCWKSPLAGFENAEPLPSTLNPDNSFFNPTREQRSSSYDSFPEPFLPNKNGFDFHIYYIQSDESETKFAKELHERVRREFPELRIYRFWDKPVGPHPVAMFEVNTFSPHETGALFTWLAVNRGPCSVLIHPNTGDPLKDHVELNTWMGRPWPLRTRIFERH